ncbi:MAG: hypothetical protein KF864_06810 [Phycisphaeraceae bacterium]|nr:hypothetical protein [Phycisphaeraceae bacterium]
MSLWHVSIVLAIAAPLLLPVAREPDPPHVGAPTTHSSPIAERVPFLPSTHGFQFRNAFRGSPLPASLRGWGIEGSVELPETFGLCGGMSLLAADHYLHGVPMPQDRTPPSPGTPLYETIYARQVESLGFMAIAATKFVQWMAMPDESETGGCIREATAQELPSLIARLDDGNPAPLGMVYRATTGPDRGKLWENHQVLVYGYEADADSITLRVYDPNYPRHDRAVIRVRPSRPAPAADSAPAAQAWREWKHVVCELDIGTGRAPRPVRGIFPMAYAPKRPAL